MRWFISKIMFPMQRGLWASKRHLFSSPHWPRGTYNSNGSFGTSKPSQLPWNFSRKNHGFADIPPVSGIAPSANSYSNKNTAGMDIEIISKEVIKPASPTPDHLRTYTLSVLDQLNFHMYTFPLVFFYTNSLNSTKNSENFISERMRHLKHSLSQTLVSFYPLAGKIKHNLHIDCNDDGVYYANASIKCKLLDFLKQPENQLINCLLPIHPASGELLSKTYPVMIQVSIFDCGGIAIGLYTCHKIIDGLSLLTFVKAWAAIASESSNQILPSFISPSVFPFDPNLSVDSSSLSVPSAQPLLDKHKYVTSRFLFDHSAIAALKKKVAETSYFKNPSAVTAVMGLLWKSAIGASSVRWGSFEKQSVLSFTVNLRSRSLPPLPPHSFGNVFWLTFAEHMANSDHLELQLLVKKIRDAIATINNDFIEAIKGENRTGKLMGDLQYLKDAHFDSSKEPFLLTSVCKSGLYEVDFGWGKPIWSCLGSGGTDLYGLGNQVVLMDTKSGDGIEAWVTIKEEDMAIFEKIPELLTFASLNPSPLEK